MKVYTDNVQDMEKDIQWLEINIQDEQPIPNSIFEKLENEYEFIKVEVQHKEFISKEDIQELLIKTIKEVSKFNAFIQKFKDEMEAYNQFFLTVDINKEHVFNLREQRIISQHESWRKNIKRK